MNTGFCPYPPTTMYIDINSCFATCEQQANPFLRGKPVAVAAYVTGSGCILAASREAKRYGVKTGMRVFEGKNLCRDLIVLPPDPEKYRFVNHRLTDILLSFTPFVSVQSIDEMIVRFNDTPILSMYRNNGCSISIAMRSIATRIKMMIREEIGDWISVSIGISTNAFLAKTASNLKKPDGLEEIISANIETVLSKLPITELCGIKQGNGTRLASHGITTTLGLYRASQQELYRAFGSVIGMQWWQWIHGWESGTLFAFHESTEQKSFSQSCALSFPCQPHEQGVLSVLYMLTAKMMGRLRNTGCSATSIGIGCAFRDGSYWHQTKKCATACFATSDLFTSVRPLLVHAPHKPIHTLFVSVPTIEKGLYAQQTFDEQELKKRALTQAVDSIEKRYGAMTITSAVTLDAPQRIMDRIAFGKSALQ